jgi:peptidoglycan/LPS O-acetylase OafA/YrhL
MNSPAQSHIRAITGLRGLAAVMVWSFHAFIAARLECPACSAGWVGVDIFFVLSGFVMMWAWGDTGRWQRSLTSTWLQYAARRVLRIFPAYYLQFAVLLALAWSIGFGPALRWGDIISHALMMQGMVESHSQSFNPVWWTLSIEFQFYLVFPAMLWCIHRLGAARFLAAAFVVAIVWRIAAALAVPDDQYMREFWLVNQLPGRLDQFAIGMVVATLVKSRAVLSVKPRGFSTDWFALGLLWACAILFKSLTAGKWMDPAFAVGNTVTGAVCGLLIYMVVSQSTSLNRALSSKVGIFLGDISYSLYLWHVIVVWGLETINARQHLAMSQWSIVATSIPLILLVSYSSWRWIEKPGMAFRLSRRGSLRWRAS